MSFAGYFLSVLFCLLSMLISDSRFDLVWFRLSCDHGWIRSGSVNNVRKQQQQQQLALHKLRGPSYSGITTMVWTRATIPGTKERGIVRCRMEHGGAHQRSSISSATFSPPIPPLSRSCIFSSKRESSICCLMKSCGLRSRSAVRCSMVGYGPRSVFALTKGSICRRGGHLGREHRVWCTLVVFFLLCRVCDSDVTGGGRGRISPGGAVREGGS